MGYFSRTVACLITSLILTFGVLSPEVVWGQAATPSPAPPLTFDTAVTKIYHLDSDIRVHWGLNRAPLTNENIGLKVYNKKDGRLLSNGRISQPPRLEGDVRVSLAGVHDGDSFTLQLINQRTNQQLGANLEVFASTDPGGTIPTSNPNATDNCLPTSAPQASGSSGTATIPPTDGAGRLFCKPDLTPPPIPLPNLTRLFSNPDTFIEGVFDFTLWLMGLFLGLRAFIYILAASIKYISAGADQKATDDAKKMIRGAIIGMLIFGLGYLLIRYVRDVVLNSFG